MKRNVFRSSVFVIGVASVCFSLAGCNSFFMGGELKKDLESAIDYANTPEVAVKITANNAYGTLTGETGGTYKLGKFKKISFTESDAYQFVQWKVIGPDNSEVEATEEDVIYITNVNSASTTFKVNKEVSGYSIQPFCLQRPEVSIASPQYQSNGVNRDRDIIITFNSEITKSNFRYTEEEASNLKAKGYTLLTDSDNLAYGYTKNGVVFYKNIKIRNANDKTNNMLNFFGVPEVSGTKLTIPPKKGADKQFKLDSNGYKDLEVTIDNAINNNGIKMRSDYVWTYRVGNVTDEQTFINFSCDSNLGELSLSGNSNYSVGSEISIKYTEAVGYKFIDWEISSADNKDYAAVTSVIYNGKTGVSDSVITVLEGNGSLKIKPVCAPRPVVETFVPSYIAAGTSFDSSIVLNLGAAVAKESFVYSQSEADSYGENATLVRLNSGDENSDIIAVDVAGQRYFKNIAITDSENENIAIHYKKVEISEDGKKISLIFDGARLFNFGENPTKDIYVSVNPSVYSLYQKNDGTTETVLLSDKGTTQDFSFRVRNASESKADVTFNVFDGPTSMGTMNHSGIKSFNLGETFKVTFEPNDAYGFIKWIVSGNEEGNLVIAENGSELNCTVTGKCENITITPFCEKLNLSTIFFEATSGSVSPSGYVDFRRKAKISLVNTINSDYCFTKWKVRNTVTKEIFSDEKAAQYFKFDNPNAAVTNVTVLQDSANLSIIATAEAKPRVYASTPNGLSESVDRDSNIRVFMNKGLSEKSLYYSDDEAKDFEAKGYKVLYENESDKKNPYGYYSLESDLSSYVFKNIKITDNSDGTNYLKYYDCPYLGDSTGKVLIIPVKKLPKSNVDSTPDPDKNLPGNREILVEIGTEFGFYSDKVLVNLENVNLIWAYKTNDSFDTTKPTIVSTSISGSCDYEAGSSIPASLELESDKKWYQKRLVKMVDGTVPLKLNVTAYDKKSNLQSVTLVAQKVVDSTYNKVTNGKISKYTLPIAISGTDGTFNGTINLVDQKTLGLDEGLYKVYFELLDQVGNKTVTDSSHYYYLLIDYTPPKDAGKLRFFYRNGKVQVQNLGSNFSKDVDYDNHTITVGGESETYSNDNTFTGLTNGENIPLVITCYDLFGNKIDYTYQLNAGLKVGMALYTNGKFSDEIYEGLVPDSVIISVSDDFRDILIAKVENKQANRNSYDSVESEIKQLSFGTNYYRLPTLDELELVYNNLSYFEKWGADDRDYSYNNNTAWTHYEIYSGGKTTVTTYYGIYYYSNQKNEYNKTYNVWEHYLYNFYSYAPHKMTVDNRYYSDRYTASTMYHMKAVLNFKDN